jgi:hypothetical protein
MVRFVADGAVFSRWLAGSAILAWVHVALFEHPSVAPWFPDPALSASLLVRASGLAVMIGGSLWLLSRWPRRWATLLPLLTPVWLLFSSAYLEYYPFLAPVLVGALCWLFERPLAEREPLHVGLLAAALGLLYVAFLPLAGLVLVGYALARPRGAGRAALIALGASVAGIALFWPEGGVHGFLLRLYQDLHVGEKAVWFAPYRGQTQPTSVFFRLDFALSPQHLLHVAFMFLTGTGLVVLPAFAVGSVRLARRRELWPGLAREPRSWLAALLLATHLGYLAFMVPKLGPARDVDLFFNAYLVAAFFAGWLLDLASPGGFARSRAAASALAAAFGSALATAGMLLLHGLTPPR